MRVPTSMYSFGLGCSRALISHLTSQNLRHHLGFTEGENSPAVVFPLYFQPSPPVPRTRSKSAAVTQISSFWNHVNTTAVRGLNLISISVLFLVHVSCFMKVSINPTSEVWVREGHFFNHHAPRKQEGWASIPEGTFQYEVESFLFLIRWDEASGEGCWHS